ncbi:hypothetical protein PV325_007775 [Microctonus aethiopoides]|nr:hypothetical protein PV325_007775 [Microctonus aethiopoides]
MLKINTKFALKTVDTNCKWTFTKILLSYTKAFTANHYVLNPKLKTTFWPKLIKWHLIDFKIPAQLWHWQDGSNDAKSLREPPTKFVTSYLLPVVCKPALLDIAPSRNLFPTSMLIEAL